MNNIYKTPNSKLDNIKYNNKQVVEFSDDGNTIKLINTLMGKEIIYVNNKMVSFKKSFSKHSTHQFSVDDTIYTLSIEVPSIMGKIIYCELTKNGRVIKKSKLIAHIPTLNFILAIMLTIFIGQFLGRFFEYMEFNHLFSIPFSLIMMIFIFILMPKKYSQQDL